MQITYPVGHVRMPQIPIMSAQNIVEKDGVQQQIQTQMRLVWFIV